MLTQRPIQSPLPLCFKVWLSPNPFQEELLTSCAPFNMSFLLLCLCLLLPHCLLHFSLKLAIKDSACWFGVTSIPSTAGRLQVCLFPRRGCQKQGCLRVGDQCTRGSRIFQTRRGKSRGSTVTDDEIPQSAKQHGAGWSLHPAAWRWHFTHFGCILAFLFWRH